jgi:hypothetical protein
MTETPIADAIEYDADDYADRRAGQFNRTYPTTWRPAVGSEFVGTFIRLDQGPENEYGTPWIVVFTGHEGGQNTAGEEMENGEEYGFWLIHSTALSQFKDARPEPGERFACLYQGTRKSKSSGREYHAYSVICPDRPGLIAGGPVSWDTIEAPERVENAPF